MNLRNLSIGVLTAAVAAGPIFAAAPAAAESVFLPMFTYRTGPFAPNGIPIANGFHDYYTLLNERDGGIEGVTVEFEECETEYNTDKGVECYERLKERGAVVINPFSTGITYQLIEKAPVDKIPILSMGYGRTDSADGRVFPWVFNAPMTYWSQASTFISYIGEQEGGMDNLEDKSVGLIYLDVAYGREPIPTFEALAETYGYSFELYPVPPASMGDQATVWLDIDRDNLDWLFMWGWGLMNSTAIKEATQTGFQMDHFIGVWWSGAEQDTVPAGKAAAGYMAATLHAPGVAYPVHDDIMEFVYGRNKGTDRELVGQVLYNRGLFNAVVTTEAVRTAILEFGTTVTGEEVRWGLENLDITAERLTALGLEGFTLPFHVTCANHEGFGGQVIFQQWDGEQWGLVSDWYEPMSDVIRPMIEASAAAYAEENGIELRSDCN